MTRDPASPSPLHIALNLLFHGPRAGGVGRYAVELTSGLLDVEPGTELTIFASRDLPDEVRGQPWANLVRWVTVPVGAGTRQALIAEHLLLPALAAFRGADVLHSPGNTGPVITGPTASVVSLHDLIWIHHADEWNPDRRAQRATRRWVGHAVRHADHLLTGSAASAADLAAEFGLAPGRLTVAPYGVRPQVDGAAPEPAIRERLDLAGRRVLLCVAQKRRYKNQERIVRALADLPADVVAVLPGARTAYEDELSEMARALGVQARVRMPDWVSDTELAGLYRMASAFVLPSLAEGFGLPVLEAMAHGVPVACSDIAVLREVAGDAAVFFDPGDQRSASAALGRLLGDADLRRDLTQRGRRRAAQFTWRRTAELTLAGYRRALAGRRSRIRHYS